MEFRWTFYRYWLVDENHRHQKKEFSSLAKSFPIVLFPTPETPIINMTLFLSENMALINSFKYNCILSY